MNEAAERSYVFDEEEMDDEEFEEDGEEEFEEDFEPPEKRDEERTNAQLKLDRLKSIRGNQAASSERL